MGWGGVGCIDYRSGVVSPIRVCALLRTATIVQHPTQSIRPLTLVGSVARGSRPSSLASRHRADGRTGRHQLPSIHLCSFDTRTDARSSSIVFGCMHIDRLCKQLEQLKPLVHTPHLIHARSAVCRRATYLPPAAGVPFGKPAPVYQRCHLRLAVKNVIESLYSSQILERVYDGGAGTKS